MLVDQKTEAAGSKAVRNLRLDKFRKGLPFMINSRELPVEECYMEYPTGIIELVKISRTENIFITIKEVSAKESSLIRSKFQLG